MAASPPGTPAAESYRVVLLPIDNEAGAPVPARALMHEVEHALATAGIEVLGGDLVDRFLARNRIRYVGGIDQEMAKAARNDLGVGGILIPSIEQLDAAPVPRIGLTMRLVSTEDEPRILWMGGIGRAGDDSPGLLDLGIVSSARQLEDRELSRLATSLVAYLGGRGPRSRPCAAEGRFGPNVSFRSREFDPTGAHSVAVLPFVNETDRRSAGEAVALEFIRQLSAVENLRVIEPGVVRDSLLKFRVVMEGGVSLDTARVMLAQTGADLVLAGYVHEYAEPSGGTTGAPKVSFTVFMLGRREQKIVWQASSHHEGDEHVFFFGTGRVPTANALACLMARKAIDTLMAPGAPRDEPKRGADAAQ